MPINVSRVTTLIQVFDMPTAVAFYRDVLGFSIIDQSSPGDDFDWGMLRLADAVLMLNTAYEKEHRPAAPDPQRRESHRDTALFFACPDVDGAYMYLKARGLDVKPPKVAPYGMKQLYVNDPDGYVLCLQCPVSTDGSECPP
jgi:glyoxylase I family protein